VATPEQIREVVEQYVALVGAGRGNSVVDLYTDDATVEDPVGTEVRRGRAAIAEFYGGLEGIDAEARLIDCRVAGHEAVFAFELATKAGDDTYVVSPFDHMVFDEDGRITAMRAFWAPERDMQVR